MPFGIVWTKITTPADGPPSPRITSVKHRVFAHKNRQAGFNELLRDVWTRQVTSTSVLCAACGTHIRLDRRRNQCYYALWVKHRRRCEDIEQFERLGLFPNIAIKFKIDIAMELLSLENGLSASTLLDVAYTHHLREIIKCGVFGMRMHFDLRMGYNGVVCEER